MSDHTQSLDTGGRNPGFFVDWKSGHTEDPKNWPVWYKIWTVFVMSFGATVVSLYSTSYTPSLPGIEAEFHISKLVGLLGVTTYLMGMAAGSLIVAPMSEIFGRRPVYIVAMSFFTLLVIPCALAHNIEAILIGRFLSAFCGSAMMANSAGSVNDVVFPQYLALAYSAWGIGPINGPVLGPILGGFVFQYLGWRWNNWLVMILGFAALVMLVLVKETYGPAILRKSARQLRSKTGDHRWWSAYDETASFGRVLKTNVARPLVMMTTEPIW